MVASRRPAAAEREQHVTVPVGPLLKEDRNAEFHASGGQSAEELTDSRGHRAGLLVREWAAADGMIRLHAERVAGPYQALAIEGAAAGQAVRLMELSLGDVSAQVGFDTRSMKLSFADVRGRSTAARTMAASPLISAGPRCPWMRGSSFPTRTCTTSSTWRWGSSPRFRQCTIRRRSCAAAP